jgi:hypothetical protein
MTKSDNVDVTPLDNTCQLSEDMSVFTSGITGVDYCVDHLLEDMSVIGTELCNDGRSYSSGSVRATVEMVRHLISSLETMTVYRKGMDMDFKGMETEVKEGRKTITQLQTAGERADKELRELRVELSKTLDELTETKLRLDQACGVVGIQLGIVENLAKVLDKVSAY